MASVLLREEPVGTSTGFCHVQDSCISSDMWRLENILFNIGRQFFHSNFIMFIYWWWSALLSLLSSFEFSAKGRQACHIQFAFSHYC